MEKLTTRDTLREIIEIGDVLTSNISWPIVVASKDHADLDDVKAVYRMVNGDLVKIYEVYIEVSNEG